MRGEARMSSKQNSGKLWEAVDYAQGGASSLAGLEEFGQWERSNGTQIREQ